MFLFLGAACSLLPSRSALLPSRSTLLPPRSLLKPPRRAVATMGGAPLDATASADVAAVASRMVTSLATKLDDEWIEQEDHVRVASVAAQAYADAREAGEDDIGRLLMKVGGEMEKVDMGECFVGPWDVANMAAAFLMAENDPEIAALGDNCGCG